MNDEISTLPFLRFSSESPNCISHLFFIVRIKFRRNGTVFFFGVHLLKAENNLLKAETLFYKVMDFRQSLRLHEIGFLRL